MTDEVRALRFRCDDGAGFELVILQARDGDFHVSVQPNRNDLKGEGEDPEYFAPCFSASVRIRMGMIGGGSHEELWTALAKLFQKHYPALKRREDALARTLEQRKGPNASRPATT